MNKIMLIGNVTKDVELKTSLTGKSFCNFDLAVRRKYPDADGHEVTDFHRCAAFGKLAENIVKYVKKGNKLFVSGELIYDIFQDKQGNNRTTPKIMIEEVEFLTPKASNEINDNPHPDELTPLDDDTLPF